MLSAVSLSSLSFPRYLAAQATRGIKGVLAPELDVPYWIDGKGKPQIPFTISQHRGKWIYLKCFQEWCPACHSIGFPNLQKLVAAFPDNTSVVSAVIQTTFEGFASNTKKSLRKNQLRYGLDLPFGHDPGNIDLPANNPNRYSKTMGSYRTGGTPWVVIINPDGMVVFNDFHIDIDKLIIFLKNQVV
jgi:thiol-disulfide isomerase/thioredoxin